MQKKVKDQTKTKPSSKHLKMRLSYKEGNRIDQVKDFEELIFIDKILNKSSC